MQSLEQVRARNALNFSDLGAVSGDKGGEVIKKIPALIQNHGLLATAAYSYSEKKGWREVFDAIAVHLADPAISIVPKDCMDRDKLMKFLSEGKTTSEILKLATAETMAWLMFARRFVKKG